jgi:uncharacterized protein (DUF433 family)
MCLLQVVGALEVSRYGMKIMESPISKSLNIMGGTPCLTGTRVPFQTLLDYLEVGDSL